MTGRDTWKDWIVQAYEKKGYSDRQGRVCHELQDAIITFPDAAQALEVLAAVRQLGWYYPSDAELKSVVLGDEEQYYYAYGASVNEQLPRIAAMLREDPHSRRAVIQFTSFQELGRDGDHVPVLLSAYFRKERDEISVTVTARSIDLVLGLPANLVQASAVLERLCSLIDARPGAVTFFINSAHVFSDYREHLQALLSEEKD